MATSDDHNPDLDRLRNMPIRSEEIGFSRDEMTPCSKCGKPNAPNRAACLYCGTTIAGRGSTKLNVRELENWEKGFNVVIRDVGDSDVETVAAELASMLGRDVELFRNILRTGRSVPLVRLESESQAAIVMERLGRLGVQAHVIADQSLHPDSRPVRLRSIAFGDAELRLRPFNPGADEVLARSDLALIAVGAIFEERIESLERRKRKEAKTLSESQLSFDEAVVDIYSRHDPLGWRIPASGFDFSCLGQDKARLAAENMSRLITRLREFSPAARIVDDYADLRSLLEHCWPGESRKDARRIPGGFGRKDVASVVMTSNTGQWTKYSRLQWHLL